MEEGVNDEDDDEKEIKADNEDEYVIHRDITEYEKETNWDALDKLKGEFSDENSPVEMEERVYDKVYDENEKNDEEKEENETTDSESTKIDEGKGVSVERGGEDVALVE